VPHVQPPVDVLEKMLTLRLHLDDADASNGALRVLPGTHRFGRLSADEIAEQQSRVAEVVCEAWAGDLLLMRPLLLHASSRATSDRPRGVLHIEFAGEPFSSGLEWRPVDREEM
jgi:ectoine hydroxylase-related dioxygenase (phytanoyl-CoA dioxygenase family)